MRRVSLTLVFAASLVAIAIACGEDLPVEEPHDAGADADVDVLEAAVTDDAAADVVDASVSCRDRPWSAPAQFPVPAALAGKVRTFTRVSSNKAYVGSYPEHRLYEYATNEDGTPVDQNQAPTAVGIMGSPYLTHASVYGANLSMVAEVAGPSIVITTRDAEASPWKPVTTVDVFVYDSESSPFGAEKLGLLLVTKGSGDYRDIYTVARIDAGGVDGLAAPVVDSVLSVANAADDSAIVTPDGLLVFFMSNRAPPDRRADVYTATRPSPNVPFQGVTRVAELSSIAAEDHPTWISEDGCTIFIAQVVNGLTSTLFRATR